MNLMSKSNLLLFFVPVFISLALIAGLLLVKSRYLTTNYTEQIAGISTQKLEKNIQISLNTSAGQIVIELNSDTPKTSGNFYDLVKKGFYNNIIFHRVIKGFMIQGGDPAGTGMGGPGYQFADEPFTGEYSRGTVAMANSGPDTNGSQFFIMHGNYPLPKSYVIFGKVISGMEVIDKIAEASVNGDRPLDPVKILSAEVIE